MPSRFSGIEICMTYGGRILSVLSLSARLRRVPWLLEGLEEEPLSPVRLVEDVLEQVAGGRVTVLVAEHDGVMNRLRHPGVVLGQALNHILRRHQFVVVVFNRLQLAYVADASDCHASDFSDPLRHRVHRIQDRLCLFVEYVVVVVEVWAVDVPVEVLRLHIQREGVGDEWVDRLGTARTWCEVSSVGVASSAGGGYDFTLATADVFISVN